MAEQQFDWRKFDKEVDIEALQQDIEEIEKNGGFADFEEIPDGEYEVAVEKMELRKSKNGDPMLTIWFKIIAGEYKGQYIFYNKVMQPQNERAFAFQVHQNNEMLRALWDCPKEKVKFEGFAKYADLIMDIHEDIDGKFEYLLEKKTDEKGYDQFEILEVYELE